MKEMVEAGAKGGSWDSVSVPLGSDLFDIITTDILTNYNL